MTRLTIILTTLILLTLSCTTEYPDSDIEQISYHNKLTRIKSISDSTYNVFSKDSSVRYETYQLDTNTIAFASYRTDTLLAIVFRTNGIDTSVAEYFPNGQLKGKIYFTDKGRLNGPATYYHENGRIRTTGYWTASKRTGQWKTYNANGQLETIKYYNDKGEVEKTEEIKTTGGNSK